MLMAGYNCFGKAKKSFQVCKTRPIRRDIVDDKAKEFIRELLLNPGRLFAWWEEQHEKEIAVHAAPMQRASHVSRLVFDQLLVEDCITKR